MSDNIYDYVMPKVDVDSVLDKYDIQNTFKNGTYWMCCPFHIEKTPSFSINAETKICKCWGCKYKSNIFGFVKEIELVQNNSEITYYEAMVKCAKFSNVKINLSYKDKLEMQEESIDDISDLINDDIEEIEKSQQETFLDSAIKKFYVKKNNYMVDRGFSKEILDYLEMGFYTGDKKNPMNNRCVFPVRNESGKLVGWTGRTILNNVQPKWSHAPAKRFLKALNLFNIDKALPHIIEQGKVNVVESPGNLIRMLESGRYNTVATLGSTISKEQCEMLLSYDVDIIFWYDWDKGGFEGLGLAMSYIKDYDRLYVAKTEYGFNDNGKAKDIADVDIETVNNTIIISIYDYIPYMKGRFVKDMDANIENDTKIKLTDGTIVLCTKVVNPKLEIRQLVFEDIDFFKTIDAYFGTMDLCSYELE